MRVRFSSRWWIVFEPPQARMILPAACLIVKLTTFDLSEESVGDWIAEAAHTMLTWCGAAVQYLGRCDASSEHPNGSD